MSDGRVRPQPTERDLAIWREVNEDLLDHLYSGLTGRFQLAGHRVISRWAASFREGVVLEIGAGHGHQLRYAANGGGMYVGLDTELKFLRTLHDRFAQVSAVNADAYALPFRDHSVDTVLAVYCFEHLRSLGAALAEIRRVLKPGGELLIGLPCEGGALYELGRKLTSKRYMEKKYGIDYDAIVRWEHWNTFSEVRREVDRQFEVIERRFIPFGALPSVECNVIGCLRARARQDGG